MFSSVATFTFLFTSSLASLIYVYKYRGSERFRNLTEYLRKGWPIFAPLNCILYIFTKPYAKKSILNSKDFPDLKILEENWQVIAKEAVALHKLGYFDKTKDPNSNAFFDVGFRTFYKYGWGKFYLKWYGSKYNSALKHCPETVKLLSQVKTVNGAMFSSLPPGSKLTRHLDPVACSLRYHLGLTTPEHPDCFINVDGQNYSWKNGEGFVFDETYLHFANNNTSSQRIILMCDVERPMFFIGYFVNFIYKILMRMTVVPNTPEDPRGFVNRVFSTVSPLLKKSKQLKKSNRPLYLVLKYTVNTVLIGLIFLALVGLIQLIGLL